MKFMYYFIILIWFCSCHPKENLSEKAIFLYEQGKRWEATAHADSTIAYYLHSFNLSKKLKNDSLIGMIGNALGDVLYIQSLYNHAISVHTEAYLYNSRLEDKTAASHSLRGIGKSYLANTSEDSIVYNRKLESALMYFSRAKKLIPEINAPKEIYSIYNNLCVYYTTTKEYNKALEYNQKLMRLDNDSLSIYRTYACRCSIFYFLQQYDSAIYYCQQALKSTNLYTQHAAYHQLSKVLSEIGSPDSAIYLKKTFEIHDLIEQQNKGEKIMELMQKSSQDKLKNEKKLAVLYITFILLALFISGFIFYRKYNRRKLLKKERLISLKETELAVEQEQTHTLRKELEESKQITNYAELKEQKREEEAKIVSLIIQMGEECAAHFRKDSLYERIQQKLNSGSDFSNEERKELSLKVIALFMPYIQEMSKYFHLADEDYFVCCLTLLGFSTKHCAIFRGVGEAAIRVQRRRIKEKLKGFFHSDKLYNSIFGKK